MSETKQQTLVQRCPADSEQFCVIRNGSVHYPFDTVQQAIDLAQKGNFEDYRSCKPEPGCENEC